MVNYSNAGVARDIERDDADTHRLYQNYLRRKRNRELRHELSRLAPAALLITLCLSLLTYTAIPHLG